MHTITRRARWGLGPLLALALVLGGCSSGGSDSESSSTTKVTVPEDVIVSDAVVATGMAELKRLAAEATSDPDRAEGAGEDIEDAWKGIEGTVKKNDPDAYLTFEEGIDGLQDAAADGNTAKVQSSADTIASSVDSYRASHPS